MTGSPPSTQNAYDPSLGWSNSSSMPGPTAEGSNLPTTAASSGTVTFDTPANENEYPVIITAESLSTTGLLDPTDDPYRPRGRTVLVTEKSWVILEPVGCLQTEHEVTIYATVAPEDTTLQWQSSGGSLQPHGDGTATYTAPSEPGAYSVTATSEQDSSATATIDILVKDDCICTYVIHVQGAGHFVGEGEKISATFVETDPSALIGVTEGEMFFNAASNDGESIPFYGTGGGTMLMSAGIQYPMSNPDVYAAGEHVLGRITWYDEFVAEAVISGWMIITVGGDPYTGYVWASIWPRIDHFTEDEMRQGNCDGQLKFSHPIDDF